jgi:hypothetical protein
VLTESVEDSTNIDSKLKGKFQLTATLGPERVMPNNKTFSFTLKADEQDDFISKSKDSNVKSQLIKCETPQNSVV